MVVCACEVWGVTMEKPKQHVYSITLRFRSIYSVFAAAAFVLWWALLTAHFSPDRQQAPPVAQSPLEQPVLTRRETQQFASVVRRLATSQAPHAAGGKQDRSRTRGLGHDGKDQSARGDSCEGRFVYMYELDPYFNEDMVRRCEKLNLWTNWCPSASNAGLGPVMENTEGVFSDSDWYTTNQFMLEQIFHNRMRRYECLTGNATSADAVFVPFYAGFEVGNKLWRVSVAERDVAPQKLVAWLSRRPEWARFQGLDHFLVGGRITWDFRRTSDVDADWGNKLFVLPATANMTMLTIEASPWHHNDVAIPYPTYFHPSSRSSLALWQARMRAAPRPSLFSFVGAPRPGFSHSIRGKLMRQCRNSTLCALLECRHSVCHTPHTVMAVFERSVFCLQPSGDSFTRRSTFDAMLAGCIPVFFHPYSAYDQYLWHLPRDRSSYSVFIPEAALKNDTARIEDVLRAFTPAQLVRMRETVIRTIPRIVYADPRSSPIAGVRDAFDITVQGVIDRIAKRKRDAGYVNVGGSPSAGPEAMSKTEESVKEQAAMKI